METQAFHPLVAGDECKKYSNISVLNIKNNIKNYVLGLRPKRTLRLVLWTGEEQGGIGAKQYYQLHKVNMSFHYFLDSTFLPSLVT